MVTFYEYWVFLTICMWSSAVSLKLSSSRLLLPYNGGSAVNFSVEVLEAGRDDCFEWHTSAPDVVQVFPQFDGDKILCAKKATISSVSSGAHRQEAIISVLHRGSERILFCETLVDIIAKVLILHPSSEMSLDGPPLELSVIAMNSRGNTFTTLKGVRVKWGIKPVGAESGIEMYIARFTECSLSPSENVCVISSENHVISAHVEPRNIGSTHITVEVDNQVDDQLVTASFELNVTLSASLKPSSNLYIFPGSAVKLSVETKYRHSLSVHNCQVKVGNSTVIDYAGDLTFVGLQYGESEVTIKCNTLSVYPGESWQLHEATSYEVAVHLHDSNGNKISPLENLKISVLFPSKLFYVNSSSPCGAHHYVQTLVPGSGIIKAHIAGLKEKGEILKSLDLSVSQKIVVYQAIQVFPPVLLLPHYTSNSTLYSVTLKATGGTGAYVWTTDYPGATIEYEEMNSGSAILHIIEEGDYLVTASDRNCSQFRYSAEVSVQPVAEIEAYATVVEAEVGNDLIIPLALLGFESKDRKAYRAFDDCTKMNVSVEIIDKHVVSYTKDSDLPPFGRGCLTLQFKCRNAGHSRINIMYESLKTTVVLSCYKVLKPVHPVRVAVLALGTAKDIAFEGGPRAWPLHPSSYFENLTAEVSSFIDINILRDPIRYNKDLHVFRIFCKGHGETALKFFVGNKPSATNRNPAQMESSIKVICGNPQSLHISYKPKKKGLSPSEKTVVKVPFYGSKIFEIDIWMKDAVGRKFANISSLAMSWTLSDYTLAKFTDSRDFLTHIDGSAGFQKISRNFQQVEMTGKTGKLVITAKLTGYRTDVAEKGGISKDIDLYMEEISCSLELHLVSMRDAYSDVYSSEPENTDQICDGDSCKA